MTASSPTAPLKWNILTQTEQTKINATGQAVEVITVAFQLDPSQIVGSVDVPRSGYNVDNVRAMITAKAQTLLDVAGLSE